MQVVNKWTGEVTELPDKTVEDLIDSWLILTETIKACERAKEQLKNKVLKNLEPNGTLELGGYMFRHSSIQRMNYNKSVMKEVLDEDTVDLFLIPDKTAIDNWLKESVLRGENSEITNELRNSMIPVGKPYTTLRLEKINA